MYIKSTLTLIIALMLNVLITNFEKHVQLLYYNLPVLNITDWVSLCTIHTFIDILAGVLDCSMEVSQLSTQHAQQYSWQ